MEVSAKTVARAALPADDLALGDVGPLEDPRGGSVDHVGVEGEEVPAVGDDDDPGTPDVQPVPDVDHRPPGGGVDGGAVSGGDVDPAVEVGAVRIARRRGRLGEETGAAELL